MIEPLNLTINEATNLDYLLIAECGKRLISPIVEDIFIRDNETYTDNLEMLSQIALIRYLPRWERLKEVFEAEYDPLSNFRDDMMESVSGTGTASKNFNTAKAGDTVVNYDTNNSTTYGGKISDTRTDQLTDTRTFNDTTTDTPAVISNTFGFNSTTAVPSSSQSGTDTSKHTGSITDANTGTQKNDRVTSGTDSTAKSGSDSTSTDQTERGVESETSTDTKSRRYTRKGNIGNHTNQQLLREEIELWKWSWHKTLIDDMKDFLTLPIYS